MQGLFSITLILLLFSGCQSGTENGNSSSTSSTASSSVNNSSSSSNNSSASNISSSSVNSSSSSFNNSSVNNNSSSSIGIINEARPLLVVRVNYNDVQFQNAPDTWSQKIFGNEEHELNHYYQEISNGHFSFVRTDEREGRVNDGIMTVKLDKNHPDSDSDSIIHSDFFQALTEIDSSIDFAPYDQNADGYITSDELLIMFIVAGNEDAFSGLTNEPGVWAHQSCTRPSNTPQLDNVRLMGCSFGGNYAVFGERHHDSNSQNDATIGIIAHELGHAAFKLPDLYDISGQSAGIGYFGLMGSGLWAKEDPNDLFGNTPVHMMAWSKIHNNWITPEVVSAADLQQTTLIQSASPDSNIVKIPIGPDEYFLLENRNMAGYDRGLASLNGTFQGGLAIWHIDQHIIDTYTILNRVNADPFHKGVDLEEADKSEMDGDKNAPGHAENLYYYGHKTEFNAHTSPSANRYDGTQSGVAISNITYPGELIDATVTNPNQEL